MPPSDFTADLPAPRDDEPSSLRQDIVDELADHLQCAVRREQLRADHEPRGLSPWPEATSSCGRSPDRATAGTAEPRHSPAYQRVLARFGDPAAVARKLWWDAMREKIMGQRILTGLTALAFVACCVMAVLMWQMLTQMQTAQRDLLAESQAQNAKLLEQFQALVGELKSDAVSEAPAEWNPLTVKCTFDTDDGPPAAGVTVRLQSGSDNTRGIPSMEKSSDERGLVDFGRVLYGSYRLRIRAPNGMERSSTVSVMPGESKQATMVCPSGDGLATITPKLVPNPSDPQPQKLADRLWHAVHFVRRDFLYRWDGINPVKHWSRADDGQEHVWYLGPNGEFVDGADDDVSVLYEMPRASLPPGPLNEFVVGEVLIPAGAVQTDCRTEPGSYHVSRIVACLQTAGSGEGIRLLVLQPPPGVSDEFRELEMRRSASRAQGGTGGESFSVSLAGPSVVEIPLDAVPYAYMQRVLTAAPQHVPLKLTVHCTNLAFVAPGQDFPSTKVALSLDSTAETMIVSGVELMFAFPKGPIGNEQRGRRGRGFGPRTPSEFVVTMLVNPDEYEVLRKLDGKLSMNFVDDASPRTSLDPDVVRRLDKSLEAKPEAEEDAATESERSPP